ncbi:MAG TPA: glycosyltransferase, partial [Candidatus Synoicihabitans sp.]|nr:glycosyltransferase [Candidatus Synoicihabitans sp.]
MPAPSSEPSSTSARASSGEPDVRIRATDALNQETVVRVFQKAPIQEVPHRCPATPLVSVLVPTYQHAGFIRQTLDSILAQQVDFPIEICIGEDGSTDGTREICLAYAEQYPTTIQLLLNHRDNNLAIGGKPTGRFNFANLLYQARGRYVAFCEGDDYWTSSEKLARQVAYLEQHADCNLTFHDADVLYAVEDRWARRHAYSEFNWCNMAERADYSVEDLIAAPLCPSASIVFRRPETWRLPRWFFEVPSGDMALETLVCRNARAYKFPACWSGYRKHVGGVTAHHRGNFIHLGRILMHLGLLCELQGEALGTISAVVAKHFAALQDPVQPEAPETFEALFEASLTLLAQLENSSPEARALRALIEQLQARTRHTRTGECSDANPLGEAAASGLRVLFVVHGPGQINGPNIWLTRLLPALRSNGFSPRVLMFASQSSACPIAERLEAEGIPCDRLPWAHTEDMVRTIIAHAQTHGCDVFVPNLNVQSYFASRLLKAAGIPTIGVLHSDDDFHHDLTDEFIRGQAARYLSAAVAVSNFQYETLKAIDHGSTKIVHAPYGAPVPPATTRYSAQPFRFVYVGRLVEEQKRISETVRAMISLLRRRPNVEFIICGDGGARLTVETLISSSGVGSRIKLLGKLGSEAIQQVLLQSQAIVLLSDYEGIPIALMEAMGCGVVPICTHLRSGIGDLIRSEVNGLLVDDRASAFLGAAERLVDDEALWTKCSTAARRTIEQSF